MKLDLNKNFINLDGKKEGDVTIGQFLSKILIGKQKNIEAIKAYDWALALWKNEHLTLDNSDFDKLLSFIEKNEEFSVLAKAQLMKELRAQRKLGA